MLYLNCFTARKTAAFFKWILSAFANVLTRATFFFCLPFCFQMDANRHTAIFRLPLRNFLCEKVAVKGPINGRKWWKKLEKMFVGKLRDAFRSHKTKPHSRKSTNISKFFSNEANLMNFLKGNAPFICICLFDLWFFAFTFCWRRAFLNIILE